MGSKQTRLTVASQLADQPLRVEDGRSEPRRRTVPSAVEVYALTPVTAPTHDVLFDYLWIGDEVDRISATKWAGGVTRVHL